MKFCLPKGEIPVFRLRIWPKKDVGYPQSFEIRNKVMEGSKEPGLG